MTQDANSSLETKVPVLQEKKKALLISIYRGGPPARLICEEHLNELGLLSETYGVIPLRKIACQVRKYDASTFLGKGKVEEVVAIAKEIQADLAIFDDEISPAQQRNLEKLFGIPVMDRTEVILAVFAQRAQTKEARLQIALAQVKYQYPRLKRLWTHLSRQQGSGGGGVYLKGEGEKQIEIDRRLLKKKIELLEKEIAEVKSNRETQRLSRMKSEIPIFAIIGYTNAGKSTLLNALTEAAVFVEDKLFATLDTTTRKYTLSNNQEILLIDTVGFIRKLPHLLIAAFKSTLEEALHADILLHLVDASHSMAEEQAAATFDVLKELGAEKKPIITLLNKKDKCSNPTHLQRLSHLYPKTVQISALQKDGFEELEELMQQELAQQRKLLWLRIPQSDYGAVSEVMRLGNILQQEFEENDVLLKADIPVLVAVKLEKYIQNAK